jgi:hypothetical protein
MVHKWVSYAAVLSACLFLTGCFEPSQEELLSKVGTAKTPADIIAAIGKPGDITSSGAMEIWRYSASGGDVCFSTVGSIALRLVCP